MIAKYMSLLLAFQLLTSCAKPNYANSNTLLTHDKNGQKLTCQVKFKTGVCVSLDWEVQPTETEFGSFILKTFQLNPDDESSLLVDLDGSLSVGLWMPSMGHGSSPVTVEHLSTGIFRVSKVFVSMKGAWEIRIQLKKENKVIDEAIIPISL